MPYIIAFLIAGIFSITQPVLAQTWSNPVGAPPTNNAAEPINVSSSGQVKTGGFGAASLSSLGGASVGGNLMVGAATTPVDQISIFSAGTYGDSYSKWSAFGRTFSGLPLYLSSGDYGYGTVWDSGGVFLGLNNRGASQKDAILGWGSNATYPTNLIYKYNGSEIARMTSVGNLGLGTTTPASKLTVAGTIHSSSGGFKFPDGTTQTTAATLGSAQWTTSGANIYNANTGNVGVGNTSPASLLSVGGNTASPAQFSVLGGAGTAMEVQSGSVNNILNLRDNTGAAVAVVKNTGNVGIGTTNPSTSLHVQGTGVSVSNSSFVSGSAGSGLAIAQGAVGDTYARLQQYNTGGTTYGNIALNPSGGNVGVAKTNPGYTLDVNGTAYATNVVGSTGTFSSITANSFTYISDKNLKKNITPLENSLSKILKLDGVSFNWKTDKDEVKKKIGFIAQDVEKVFPEAVSGDKVKGVEYGNLVAPLVEAVKEQQAQIESQKKEIESLKNEKQILEKRLIKIEQTLGL